jgi:PAS domain-containing protein
VAETVSAKRLGQDETSAEIAAWGLQSRPRLPPAALVVPMPAQRLGIIDANPAGCRVLECRLEELRRAPISQIHPAELPQLQAFFDTAGAEGWNWTIAMSCRTKSGRYIPTEITLRLFDTGSRVYVVGLLRDRSEHRGAP